MAAPVGLQPQQDIGHVASAHSQVGRAQTVEQIRIFLNKTEFFSMCIYTAYLKILIIRKYGV